ncbi:MAG: deoxynucleoside kinase [Bacteroidota bacterium]|nr:deoxynucleoside kinase [Bacteroidota bacterium]
MDNPYTYISIEGNIGAGKSTLARLMAERTGARYLPEHFEDNAFLHSFYKDPQRYAFTLELAFLEERFRQVRDAAAKGGALVSDYFWDKSLVFGRVNLAGEELRLFERLYNVLANQLPVPDLVIYLHRPPERLLAQINRRGRNFEQAIPYDYLAKVGAGYRNFFASEKRMPVLWLTNDYGPEALLQEVLTLTSKRFSNGLNLIP